MSSFFIDPNIAKAKTLDSDFYLNPHYFQEAKEKIFAASWQLVGHTDQVKEAGWITPVTLLEHYLHEPVVLSKDSAGMIHCVSNVCTHRGNLLVEKPCKANDIRCKYHGRRFGLDGTFHSMPEFKEVENFPTPADNLTNIPLYNFANLLFASLHALTPAEIFFAEMKQRISWMPLEKFVFRPELSREYVMDAHWALYCENYLEGFHIPYVHAGLSTQIEYGNYSTELYPYSNLQLAISKNDETSFELPKHSPDYGKNVGAYYFWVFPNMMFNFYPWGLSVNIVKPLAMAKTQVSFLLYVWDESKLRQGAGSDLHGVEMEDEDIVQQVQKGIRSRFYSQGRYSVTREQGTHHFHRLIAEFMK
jgi:choline monooxygenase